jgi:Na+/proline symporter
VFITFVTNHLPSGIVGLLIAVILSAAMSSASSELNALATTTVVDVYQRSLRPGAADAHYLAASKWFTFGWGIFAIFFTQFAHKLDNLIQAVNVLGSLVYGVILGIFVVAFFLKKVHGRAVFWAALASEAMVLYLYFTDAVPFLWLNVIGCLPLVALAWVLQQAENAWKGRVQA